MFWNFSVTVTSNNHFRVLAMSGECKLQISISNVSPAHEWVNKESNSLSQDPYIVGGGGEYLRS